MSAYIPDAIWYDYETVSKLNIVIASQILYCETSLHGNLNPNIYRIYLQYFCSYYRK